jgi:tRNA pseudouridine13 synthase
VAGDLVVDNSCVEEGIAQSDDDKDDATDAIFSSVREVTPEEASAGVFSITDVVLPLPGSRVIYSERLKTLYDGMCKADGVQLVGFAHAVREYSFGFLTVGLNKLNAVVTLSLKAPGFNP